MQARSQCHLLLVFRKQSLKYLHVGSLVVAQEPLVAGCGIEFPCQGLNPGPLHWDHGVLAIGLSGKSLAHVLFNPHLNYG